MISIATIKNSKKLLIVIAGTMVVIGLLVFNRIAQAPATNDNAPTQSGNAQSPTITPEPTLPDDLQPPANASEIAGEYIGLSEAEATAKADQNNLTYRVIARDDETIPITMDYRPDRMNFTVQNGQVTKVDFY